MTDEEFNKLVDNHKNQWKEMGIEAHHPNCLCIHCVREYKTGIHPDDCGCIHCTGWFGKRAANHPFFDLIYKLRLAQNDLEAMKIESKIKGEQIATLEGHLRALGLDTGKVE